MRSAFEGVLEDKILAAFAAFRILDFGRYPFASVMKNELKRDWICNDMTSGSWME